jgi:proteasome lid subunit RPN8/RPN11
MLVLPYEVHEIIAAHGETSYPNEGCGLLLGHVEDGRNVVTGARPLPNVWPVESEKPERFRIAEDDWRDVELEAISEGLDIVGIFHSHPDSLPVASPRDLDWASWPGYSYLITQVVMGRSGLSRSWQLAADRSGFIEEIIEIKESHAKSQRAQS